jgi:hypothetical protein
MFIIEQATILGYAPLLKVFTVNAESMQIPKIMMKLSSTYRIK